MTRLVPASARAGFQLSGEAVDTRWFTPRTQGLMTHGARVAGDLKGAAGPGSGLVVGRVSEGVNNFVPCKSPVLAEESMT